MVGIHGTFSRPILPSCKSCPPFLLKIPTPTVQPEWVLSHSMGAVAKLFGLEEDTHNYSSYVNLIHFLGSLEYTFIKVGGAANSNAYG